MIRNKARAFFKSIKNLFKRKITLENKRKISPEKIANQVAEEFVGRKKLTREQRILIRKKMKEIDLRSLTVNEEIIETKKSFKLILILDELKGTTYFFPLSKFARKTNSVFTELIKLKKEIKELNISIEYAKKTGNESHHLERNKKLIENQLNLVNANFIKLDSFRDKLISSKNPKKLIQENSALLDYL
jgi:hypothetical protein